MVIILSLNKETLFSQSIDIFLKIFIYLHSSLFTSCILLKRRHILHSRMLFIISRTVALNQLNES